MRTVGFSTDGHGRAALAGIFRHEVNGGAGRASPCGRPAARAPSRDKGSRDGTGDRRQALPATGHPGPAAGLSRITEISGAIGVPDESANGCRRPNALRDSDHRT